MSPIYVPPAVSSVTPTDGSTGVARTAAITAAITGSPTINGATFIVAMDGALVPGAVSFGGGVATFTPTERLEYGETYRALLTTGTGLVSPYTWSFSTVAEPGVRQRGAMNVIDALRAVIAAQLPALIAARVADSTAECTAYFDGPYTVAVPFVFAVNGGTPVTVTVTPGSYTAAALATALNADPGFVAAGLRANADGSRLRVYLIPHGAFGTIQFVSGASILGIQDGRTVSYVPLRDLAQIEPGYSNVEPVAYPALRLWCTREEMNADHLEVAYTVAMRLYESDVTASWGEVLYRNLAEMARLIEDVLVNIANANLGGRVTDVRLLSIAPGVQLEQGGAAMWRGSVDLACRVLVQENI